MGTPGHGPRAVPLLFVAVFLEGFLVLASEIIAIRQITPFVGNGIDTVSIVISAVLVPLAVGYYHGGLWRRKHKARRAIRMQIARNLSFASMFFCFGLSAVSLQMFFSVLAASGIEQRLVQTALHALVFLVVPFYLLAQTVPLISNYFAAGRYAELTGRLLFFSTAGSFLGSVFTTMVVMSLLGVNYAIMMNAVIALVLAVGLTRRHSRRVVWEALVPLALTLLFNHPAVLRGAGIIDNNVFSTIALYESPDRTRVLSINGGASSIYNPETGRVAEYIDFVQSRLIGTYQGGKLDILVIGAGGFTLGLDDTQNHYTFVDIDGSLKRHAEERFLERPVGDNKTFVVEPARAFLLANTRQYDLVLLDVFNGNTLSIPADMITADYFELVKKSVKPEGLFVANMIIQQNLADRFSQKMDNTLRAVFPYLNRYVIGLLDPWRREGRSNVVYYGPPAGLREGGYTDNRNDYFLDH